MPCLPKVAAAGMICLMDQVMGHADQRRSNSRVFTSHPAHCWCRSILVSSRLPGPAIQRGSDGRFISLLISLPAGIDAFFYFQTSGRRIGRHESSREVETQSKAFSFFWPRVPISEIALDQWTALDPRPWRHLRGPLTQRPLPSRS